MTRQEKEHEAWKILRRTGWALTYLEFDDPENDIEKGWGVSEPCGDGCSWANIVIAYGDPVAAVLAAERIAVGGLSGRRRRKVK